DGKPGNIIYTLENQKPVNEDDLNKFTLIKFDEELILEGPFYIGWQKIDTDQMLNVGFDANRINNDKLFYNFNEWKQSQFEGTIMLRPMFGHNLDFLTSINNKQIDNSINVKIYPNPAQDILNIDIQDQSFNNYRYTIFDTFGRIYLENYSSDSEINISNLNPGIYFIKISDSNGGNTTKKFIVIR
ncbi:MAG: T9SS type A sorting domain-containing protein, partial [Bacteroidales bacterium]|nr:T9SS type A sorting domain-containing protein [Bacteroidales bacterium]